MDSESIKIGERLTFVSPYPTKCMNNSKLLSKIKGNFDSGDDTSDNSSKVMIPIFKDSKISQILQQNNVRLLQNSKPVNSGLVNGSSVENTEEFDSRFDNDNMEQDDYIVKYFTKIELFLPRNLKEQITTVCIKHLPNIKKSSMEMCFNILLSKAPNSSYKWTMIINEQIDDRFLYLRFSSIGTLKWFSNHVSGVFSKISHNSEVTFDPAAKDYMESDTSTVDLTKEINEVRRIIDNRKNHEEASKGGTEDLDEVMQSYDSYKVDKADLVDVPKDMKAKTISNIIKFRSRVLTIEKERRKREIDFERRKAKNRLKQIFEGIKEASTNDDNIDDKIDDTEEVNDEMPELSEAEYEKYLEEQNRKELEKRYEERLDKIRKLEQSEKSLLSEKLSTLQNYEKDLIDNKFLYIEEIRNFEDFNVENSVTSNEKTSRLRLYYTDHSEYLRLRNKERSIEEQKDKIDEEDEVKVEELVSQPIRLAKIPEPLAVLEPNGPESKTFTGIIDVSSLSQDKLNKIKEKISDLIEEYLGIKEKVLIEFIYDFLLEKNLESKEELIHELDETLDEDSVIVVDDLWKYIEEIS